MSADGDKSEMDVALDAIPEALRPQWKKMQDALKEANESDKKRRLRLQELEDAESKRKLESLSEIEKVKLEVAAHKERADKLQMQLEKRELDAAIAEEATRLKFKNVRYAGLADLSGVKRGDDGKYTGVKEALEALIANDPDIVQKTVVQVPGTPPADDGRKAATEQVQQQKAAWKAPN